MLIEEIAQLPVHPGVGMRILGVLDDPRSSARDLGRLIEADPALTAQVIRLSNTAFYGMSGQIGSAWRAVTVLGHATVRALAATAAFGVLSESSRDLPANFWPHSIMTAGAAMVIAREAKMSPEDAFSAGLLLDIGQALMYRRLGDKYASVVASCSAHDATLTDAEREAFGVSHADLGSFALACIRMPQSLVEAVHDHHYPPVAEQDGMTRVLIAAAALSDYLEGGSSDSHVEIDHALAALGIPMSHMANICGEVTVASRDLSGFIAVTR